MEPLEFSVSRLRFPGVGRGFRAYLSQERLALNPKPSTVSFIGFSLGFRA